MLVKINSKDIKGLSELGVSNLVIEKIENAKKAGKSFNSVKDLFSIGLPQADADLISGVVSFAPPEPETEILSAEIKTEPAQLLEYTLFVKYINKNTDEIIQDVYLLDASGRTKIRYDNKLAGESFSISVKAPNGEFIQTEINGKKSISQDIKKEGLNNTKITVTPFREIETNTNVAIGVPSKLKGRLISNSSNRDLENIQMVFFIATAGGAVETPDYYPVAYAVTETDGYFFSSQLNFRTATDYNNIIGAKAKIGIDGGQEIAIHLEPGNVPTDGSPRGQLPERIILYLEEPASNSEADKKCDCECSDLDFHQKKVLDEFSYYTVVRTTEPLIKAHEINDVDEVNLEDILDGIIIDPVIKNNLTGIRTSRSLLRTFIQRNGTITKENVNKLVQETQANALKNKLKNTAGSSAVAGRVSLDITNSIDWDEKPTIYEAVSIAHGHLLNFKQEWFADGYSIGDLLYSLPLAPGQKKQIVVFDWDRKDSAANTQRLDYQETLYNSLSRDRDINEIANATVNEKTHGESDADTWGIGGGIGGVVGNFVLGVAGGYGSASSSADQNSSRNSTASSQQHVHDRTVQAASSVRSQRATVIQTVSQGERFQVSAEVIANYNHCHAMTVQYFEVLRHFEITTKLANVKECLFIPLEFSPFDRKKALRWRDILAGRLKKRNLRKGFDAIERIEEELESGTENYYDKIGFPKNNYAEFALTYLEGELYIEFDLKRPADDADEFVLANWSVFSPWLGDPHEFYKKYLKNTTEKDQAFFRHAGPLLAKAVIDALSIYAVRNGRTAVKLPIDATLLSDFRNRAKLNVSLRMSDGFASEIRRENIDAVEIQINGSSQRLAQLLDLMNAGVRAIVHSGTLRYRTDHSNDYLFRNNTIKNDLTVDGDNVRIYTPLSREELRSPRNEDVEACNSLLHHLNENLEYYHQAIWGNMDAQRRFMLLDGILAPGKANGRSVASVVENRLIGVVGNCLVMPVAAGFQLDPTLDDKIDLYQHYYQDPLDPIRLSLPTKGVFAEAVMGKCNSCEKKDETRFWRWEESPIPDSPTTINPVTTPTPQNVQPNLQVKDFPSPIINLQNAPSIPDPQGYGALAQLISNPNLFRDVTGLAANQANAMGAMNSSLSAAQSFGDKALSLRKMENEKEIKMKELQSRLEQIKQAKKDGLLTPEQANQAAIDAVAETKPIPAPTTEETIADTNKKIGAINDMVEKGWLTKEQGQTIASKIASEGLADSAKTPTENANELAKKIDGLNNAIVKPDGSYELKGQENAAGIITPEAYSDINSLNPPLKRTFNPDRQDKSGEIEIEALVYDAPAGSQYKWSTTGVSKIKIADPTNPKTKIVAGEPGITNLAFEILDNKGQSLRRNSVYIGVPQFFVVMDSYYEYPYFDGTRNISKGHTFDAVLSNLGLLADKSTIIGKIKLYVESAMIRKRGSEYFGHNVRVIWKIANLNEGIPDNIFNPKGLSAPTDADGYYTVISMSGYPPPDRMLFGLTVPNPAQPNDPTGPRNFIELITIFSGTFELNTLNTTTFASNEDENVYKILHKLISVYNSNRTNSQIKDLLVEVFCRFYTDVICHEMYHTLIYHKHDTSLNVTDTGFDSQGHTLSPPLDNDIMVVKRDFRMRTAIEVTDLDNFPTAGTYILHPTELMSSVNSENRARVDVFFPLPPTIPFDK